MQNILNGLPSFQAGDAPNIDILEFARSLDFHPDPAQARLLTTTSKKVILNCTRQWGKSTVAAVRAVHLAVTRPGSLIIVTARAERQSGEFLKKSAAFLNRCSISAPGDGVNRLSLLLPNGSRIVAIPKVETNTRGFSAVDLLIFDEAACVPDDLYIALRPMLAVSSGDIWLLSTPRGKRGFFYNTWAHGGPEWDRVRIPASECPRISPAFLERERDVFSEEQFQQEYNCEFTATDDQIFDRDLIDRCVSDTEQAWEPLP